MSSPTNFKSGFVAVVGRPNVGKSTLLNALLGQKIAIVSPRPQTTRRKQLGILTLPEAQIIFVDTPGFQKPRHALDRYMLEAASSVFGDADEILWVVDIAELPGAADRAIAKLIAEQPSTFVLLAMNKSDVLQPKHIASHTEAFRELAPRAEWQLISATRGDNLEKIVPLLTARLPEGPQYYDGDEATDFYQRDIAAELIREAALNELRDEVPHGIAVEIEEFKDPQGKGSTLSRISATIYVERENHKGIVIGKGGAQLKRIGEQARKEIEAQLEGKVFLELQVKVRENWRQNEQDVRRFGYAA